MSFIQGKRVRGLLTKRNAVPEGFGASREAETGPDVLGGHGFPGEASRSCFLEEGELAKVKRSWRTVTATC